MTMTTLKILRQGKQRGQLLVFFALAIVVVILFLGMGIDFGFAYLTRASLSKAVDAAALAAVRNLSFGNDAATTAAKNTFLANYGNSGRDSSLPSPNVTIAVDATGTKTVKVDASTTINTFFIRVLPQWSTLNIGSTATALRARLIMTLVLDRSGSMKSNGGAAAMPAAVSGFIDFFDDSYDSVAVVTFDGNSTVDLAMTKPFKAGVNAAVKFRFVTNPADGYTFSDGGLKDAKGQEDGLSVPQSAKVVVFFTDGLANTFQDTFNCGAKGNILVNLTGGDSGTSGNARQINPTTGKEDSSYCSGLDASKQFTSIDGAMKNANLLNARTEGQLRAQATAGSIRTAGITIYSIGLGNNLDETFLRKIANQKADGSAFTDGQPVGMYLNAPTADKMSQVFQTIASTILLRLTQ